MSPSRAEPTASARRGPTITRFAPASGLTAHSYSDIAMAPKAVSDAAMLPGEAAPKLEKVWWRGRGFGWRGRGFGWRGGWGWRRPFIGYGFGWRRPYWRRRWFY